VENVEEDFDSIDCKLYDLELYNVPAVVKKVLRIQKNREIMEIRTTRKDKLTAYFDDEIFKQEWLSSFQ
jgi:hypothetical protein